MFMRSDCNHTALECALDQYKEKKPSDPTIAEKFNTYRFADYKEKVIDMLKRETSVSVGTMEVVEAMKNDWKLSDRLAVVAWGVTSLLFFSCRESGQLNGDSKASNQLSLPPLSENSRQ